MLVHRRVTPSIKFASTHLYTWVERGTVRVKCLAQEHNTMSPARARTQTARSGDERTNHEATAPPTSREKGSRLRWLNTVFDTCGSFTFFLKTLDPSVVKNGSKQFNTNFGFLMVKLMYVPLPWHYE